MLGVVRECLRICDHNINLVVVPGILEFDTLLEGTYIMSYVKMTCRTVTGQYNLFHNLVKTFLSLIITLYRGILAVSTHPRDYSRRDFEGAR